MSTRICRDCKYRMNIANTEETGVAICSKPNSCFVVNIDNHCHFIPKKRRYTCYDCLSYGNDPGCLGMRPDEEPYWGEDEHLCHAFEEKYTNELYDILTAWYELGLYDRDKIIGMIDDFEKQISGI